MNSSPIVSVIIPTHNRRASLRRTLDALYAQEYQQLEVLVVADGCTDGTVNMVRRYDAPYPLQVIEQPGKGAAAARNCGARSGKGSILLFLDDDIEPMPQLVGAHMRARAHQSDLVVIGYYPPVIQKPFTLFQAEVRAWWEDKFRAMRQPGHRYCNEDLLSGNLSLEAELFDKLGGFDEAFPNCGGEDYEFGVRLIESGATLTFCQEALGYHHRNPEADCGCGRQYQEGRADVLIGQRHPALTPELRLAEVRSSEDHVLRTVAFTRPTVGDALATRLQHVLNVLEQMRLRNSWGKLLGALHRYWYWRGVAKELHSQDALRHFLKMGGGSTNTEHHEIDVDLTEGLEAAKRRLDKERPTSIRVRYGQHTVGRVGPKPGAERLQGVHLRRLLAEHLTEPLITAITMESTENSALIQGLDHGLQNS